MTARIFQAIIVYLLFAAGVFAADLTGGGRQNQPIQIKSNSLSTEGAGDTAIFTGKVTARQGDVTIYCDRLIISYSKKDKDVDKVEAFGNVRIIQGDKIAQAGHAVYESKVGKITLDDNPRMYQGENEVSGEVITYSLDTQSSVVSGPVKVVIKPKGKGQDGSASP